MTGKERKEYLKKFKLFYSEHNSEKQDSQKFWLSLLKILFDLDNPEEFITFEDTVKLDKKSFIDGYIESTHTLIEQKSASIDLNKKIKQSDGTYLTPYEQAKRYNNAQKYSKKARWIVTCNFKTFHIYDMENLESNPIEINLEDIDNKNVWHRFDFLIDKNAENATIDLYFKEKQLSEEAGILIQRLYDLLEKQYSDSTTEKAKKSINVLCVRLVFLFYADSAEIFDNDLLRNYLSDYKSKHWHKALTDLFKVLDTKYDYRSSYDIELNKFPYVNGGLFHEHDVEVPLFTDEIVNLILNKCMTFNWSEISPTIFGGIFESTMNPDTRRKGGMHYTSIENIHKVINPLFLDGLKKELEDIKLEHLRTKGDRNKLNSMIEALHSKLESLTFLDPACGSGNFLTETFISLRKIENELIMLDVSVGQYHLIADNPVRVSISQFYGIEINDFAVAVAKTALWIAELQMMKITQELIPDYEFKFLPLHTNASIVEGNALQVDWESIISKDKLSYIMGNPPFVGKKEQTKIQKQELFNIFGKNTKGIGNLDYVTCWYRKAVDLLKDSGIKAAFVSTNSITQGEQVPVLWKELLELGIYINFAYSTFRWDSEASIKANVHCVIIGFSCTEEINKRLYTNDKTQVVENINPYLVNAPTVLISSRSKTICKDVPKIIYGSMPVDDGHLILNKDDVDSLINENHNNEQFIRKYVGGAELLKSIERWCLWLVDASPKELQKSSIIKERIRLTAKFRKSRNRPQTVALADTPSLFGEIRQPNTEMIVIPKVSSENRRYIPLSYVSPDVIVNGSALIIPNASLYYFGILISNVHMAWMRTVAGRMKSDYQYSGTIVYNNFPFPEATTRQQSTIKKTAQAILDARAKYPDCTLADLYDETTMQKDLRDAHNNNDKAVLRLYGLKPSSSEEDIITELFKRYKMLCG